MTTAFWLRTAALISLLFAIGHSLGGLSSWSPMGDNAVLHTMKAVQFTTMGATRSYYNFFIGFGISLSVSMLVQTGVLWFLAPIATVSPRAARPIILVFLLASLVSVGVTWQFIFPVPALFSLVLTVVLGLAAWSAGKAA